MFRLCAILLSLTPVLSGEAMPDPNRELYAIWTKPEISDHLPIKIEFIESREKVDLVLPELEKRTGSGLIEIQETTIVVPAKL